MLRKIAATVATTSLVLVLVVGVVPPATAAGVPPSVLPSCGIQIGSQADVGGWAVRDFVSSGSFTTAGVALDDATIRPLGTRLGEPCFYGASGGVLTVPARHTEAPVPMRDVNADGKDDGAPPPPTPQWNTSTYGSTTITLGGVINRENRGSSLWERSSWICYRITGSMTGLSIYANIPAWGGTHAGININPSPGTNVVVTSGGNPSWTTNANFTPTTSSGCTSPFTGAFRFDVEDQGGTNPTGIMWAAPSLPSRIWLAPTGTPAAGTGGTAIAPEAPGVRYYGGTQGAKIAIPGTTPAGQTPGYVRCSATYDAATTFDLPVSGAVAGDGVSGPASAPPVVSSGVATSWSTVENYGLSVYPYIKPSDCPYLVAIKMWVTTYLGSTESVAGHVLADWTADRWRTHQPYPSGQTEIDQVCLLWPQSPGCYEILNPPYVDGTNFEDVCADAPEPTWAVWSWLGPWVGHYARCLFVPVNGWDRNNEVSGAWTQGPGGDVTDLVVVGYEALTIPETCGVLMSAPLLGYPVEIDTCSWTYADPIHEFLFWAILVLGYLGLYRFLVDVLLGLQGGKMPNPVAD